MARRVIHALACAVMVWLGVASVVWLPLGVSTFMPPTTRGVDQGNPGAHNRRAAENQPFPCVGICEGPGHRAAGD